MLSIALIFSQRIDYCTGGKARLYQNNNPKPRQGLAFPSRAAWAYCFWEANGLHHETVWDDRARGAESGRRGGRLDCGLSMGDDDRGVLNGIGGECTGTPSGTSGTASSDSEIEPKAQDMEDTAREAISHLAFHGLRIRWDIPGEPSEAGEKDHGILSRGARDSTIPCRTWRAATSCVRLPTTIWDWRGLRPPRRQGRKLRLPRRDEAETPPPDRRST